ncbi:WD repeat-containing protein 87 [Podochytrium sp. JEL0797]|nr:WD repeat-containing protein 87 [Podochytrium sp. JEL0797]
MEFIESKSCLLCGEAAAIRVYKISRSTLHHIQTFTLTHELTILHTFEFDQWITVIKYDRTFDRIIAGCDNFIYYFDFKTGAFLDSFRGDPISTITCFDFYEPLEYLVVGFKSGALKVFNIQNRLIHEFDKHTAPLTTLHLLEPVIHAAAGAFPVVLSSSLDGTLRMWNIDLGLQIYRHDVGIPITHLQFTGTKETMLLHSADSIQFWTLNRTYHEFSFANARPFLIQRYTRPCFRPARLLCGYLDGSLRLISPITGEVLVVGFPMYKEEVPVEMEYDTLSEKIFVHNANGDILVYSAKTNPMRIVEMWELPSAQIGWEPINCIRGIHFISDPPHIDVDDQEAVDRKNQFKSHFFLVGGAANGQLMNLGVHHKGKQEMVVQAHSAEITALLFDQVNFLLISAGKDFQIKVWNISARDASSGIHEDDHSKSPYLLTCQAILTLCHLNDSRFENPHLVNSIMCINPYSKTIAFPWNGKLRIFSYESDAKLHPRQNLDKKPAMITYVASNSVHDIWVTSDAVGAVKVWNSKGAIIREILFNQSIFSIQFANLRGDILVGLADQIVSVYLQDYFILPLLKDSLEKSNRLIPVQVQDPMTGLLSVEYQPMADDELDSEQYNDANGFQDDAVERPLLFDPHLDFWGIFYEDQKAVQEADSFSWHIEKNPIIRPTNMGVRIERDIALWGVLKVDPEETLRRRNRRLFLSKEAEAFEKASKFETNFVSSQHNAAHVKPPSIHKSKPVEEMDSEITLDGDYVMIRRVDSSDVVLETGLNVSTPENELQDDFLGEHSAWRKVQKNLVVGCKFLSRSPQTTRLVKLTF